MKQLFCILYKVAVWVLTAAVWVWFFPIMISMFADGSWQRQKQRERNNEYWYRRQGVNQWLRQFEQQQHKKRKKQRKKRNNFYK